MMNQRKRLSGLEHDLKSVKLSNSSSVSVSLDVFSSLVTQTRKKFADKYPTDLKILKTPHSWGDRLLSPVCLQIFARILLAGRWQSGHYLGLMMK